jgi:dihydroorotate dehydrogenase electron transfer subunit
MNQRAHRGTIFAEQAIVQSVKQHPAEQFVVRLDAPRCAAAATPGSFIHLQCDQSIPMRRPLSIMRAHPAEGYIDVLFKVVGPGLKALAEKRAGDTLDTLGPIGRGFTVSRKRPRTVLIGGGVGIPPVLFLAETLHADGETWQPTVLMGSELPFPFTLKTPNENVSWLADNDYQTLALLEALDIPGRLASLSGFPGTYRGYVTNLADELLASLSADELKKTEIFACGPTPMLAATADLARRYDLPCQVSLEEFMACAVGGCAGCTVLVQTDTGPAMRRVCVDGPVFNAAEVFSATQAPA